MTTLSLNALAELLDTLAREHGVWINETPACVVASKLDVGCARTLVTAVEQLQWSYQLVDSANNAFTLARLDDDFAPYRLTLHKVPPKDDGTLYLLSATGFSDMLERGHPADHWRLARLQRSFITWGRVYGNWDEPLPFNKAAATRSPRALVRETAVNRRVPEDVRFWLLDEHSQVDLADPLQGIWAAKAFDALARSLANELEADNGALVFRGPPTLQLDSMQPPSTDLQTLGIEGFNQLQTAARWVYEWSREAELRHAMLSTEIARSGRETSNAATYFATHLANALEGAKVVYQLHLSDLTLDTLNALSTLRGNVSDDAARTTESTQQALTKVAAALGVGLTVIATRIGNDISPWLVLLAMAVACVYCLLELLAGWRLIRIRRSAREAWHPRLYRFLPSADYCKMVIKPAQRSERVYLWATGIGFALVVMLSLAMVIWSFYGAGEENFGAQTKSEPGTQQPERGAPRSASWPATWLAIRR
jgi:hypothetical protein